MVAAEAELTSRFNGGRHDYPASDDAFFKVSSEAVLGFVYETIHKHCTVLDLITATYPPSRTAFDPRSAAPTPLAAVKLFGAIVLSLQDFICPMPWRPFCLWGSERPPATDDDRRASLGFFESRAELGFAFWPRDVVDWRILAFRTNFSDRLQLPEFRAKRKKDAITHVLHVSTVIDQILRLAARYGPRGWKREDIWYTLLSVLGHSYRQVVCEKAFCRGNLKNIREDLRQKISRDEVDFSYAGLLEAYDTNEADAADFFRIIIPRKWADPFELLRWMWTDHYSSKSRKHIKSLPFRLHYKEVVTGLNRLGIYEDILAYKKVGPVTFEEFFFYNFLDDHQVLPLPESQGTLMSTGKLGERLWVGVKCLSAFLDDDKLPWSWTSGKRDWTCQKTSRLRCESSIDVGEIEQSLMGKWGDAGEAFFS
jgi:hypothetical protein